MSDMHLRLRELYQQQQPRPKAGDGMARRRLVLDDAGEPVASARAAFTIQDIRHDAVAAVRGWLDDANLDDGETLSDRLRGMLIGVVDDTIDDRPLDDDEHVVLDTARFAAWRYLARKGAPEEDLELLIDDWDDAAAERVRDLIVDAMPDKDDDEDEDDEDEDDDDDDDDEDEDNKSIFDAVYKKAFVFRDGKKVKKMKRVSGKVRLSAAQKVALRKATRKANRAGVRVKRMKTMRVRKSRGM